MYDIFSLKDYSFPEGFLWGSGYAGHQVEGNNKNNWFWDEEMAGLMPEKSGLACNSYEMFRDDIRVMSELGHQAFRTSVEWCRVEPEQGVFSQKAADHYVEFFSGLKEKGIKVFCTVVHATHPSWFEKIGAFKKIENLSVWENYLEFIIPKIAPYVDFWNVINEFNFRPDVTERLNHVKYHAVGYHIIKKYSKAPVSTAHALTEFAPYRHHDKLDNLMTSYKDYIYHEFFFHAIRTGEVALPFTDGYFDRDIKDTCDYWSINLYTTEVVDGRKADGMGKRYDCKELKMIPKDFYLEEMYPQVMIDNLSRLTDKPVYISENGCCCYDDRFRIVYISLYLSALAEAIRMGVDVRGYLYWSLLDNYEWGSFIPKFGLVDVNRESGNFERTPKPSAYFYRDIIENNGFNQEILRKYLKTMPSLDASIK